MKRLIAALMLAATLFYAWDASRHALANTAYFQARFILDAWQRNAENFSEDSLKRATEAIERSTAYLPENSHYQLTKAKISLWSFHQGAASAEDLAELAALYQHAIRSRPLWPESYADQAWYVSAVKQQPTEAWQSITQAMRYGPYHPDTIVTALNVTFTQWHLLTAPQKAQAYQWLARGVQTSARQQLFKLVQHYQKQYVACFYLQRQSQFSAQLRHEINQQLCQQ